MEDHWDRIGSRGLMQLTLPGSHNAGNGPDLSADRICESDYRYSEFLRSREPNASEPELDRKSFDAAFLPWNVNHKRSFLEQLVDGCRWFHLKICNFNGASESVMDVKNVYHQHRGYTSQHSVWQMLEDVRQFLLSHPYEVIVLSFNNLHNNISKNFETLAFVSGLRRYFFTAGVDLITIEEFKTKSLGDLKAAQKRVAVFVQGQADMMPPGFIASNDVLTEDWDGMAMASGDLSAASQWLRDDLRSAATRRGRFFALQANPNQAEENMYSLIRQGLPPFSLEAFLDPFLKGLEKLILDTVDEEPGIMINAIATDFIETARVFDMAMQLNGLISTTPVPMPANASNTSTSTSERQEVPAEGEPNGGDTEEEVKRKEQEEQTTPGTSLPVDVQLPTTAPPTETARAFTAAPPSPEALAACINPVVSSGVFADVTIDTDRWQLAAAHVMQRHTDRWVYRHDVLGGTCWPHQLNSSIYSSDAVAEECRGVPVDSDGHLTTTWEHFGAASDPYAAPFPGTCQVWANAPQSIRRGTLNAATLGELMKERYQGSGLLAPSCEPGSIQLQADRVHKNELTVQTEFETLCGRSPTVDEFPPEATLVGYSTDRARGTPWYVQSRQCGGEKLTALLAEAEDAGRDDSRAQSRLERFGAKAAQASGHNDPTADKKVDFIDSIIDCVVVHSCMRLQDTPEAFLNGDGFPDVSEGALFRRINQLETSNRTWPFEYFQRKGEVSFQKFASLYYGYFLTIIADQLLAAVAGDKRAPKLTVSVMSDSNISPLLALYGLSHVASLRPPYLSTLVHELYYDSKEGKHAVLVLFNGEAQPVCGNKKSKFPLCPLDEWIRIVAWFRPSRTDCPVLYSGYEFLTEAPAGPVLGFSHGGNMLEAEESSAQANTTFAVAVIFFSSATICLLLCFFRTRKEGSEEELQGLTHSGGVARRIPVRRRNPHNRSPPLSPRSGGEAGEHHTFSFEASSKVWDSYRDTP